MKIDGLVIVQTESEERLEDLMDSLGLDGNLTNETLEELTKMRRPMLITNEDLPEPLKQKIERIARVAIDEVNVHVHSTSTESQPQFTVPAPAVESTTIVYESSEQSTSLLDEDFAEEWVDFERLLHGEFSDEEWIELERLLDTASGRKPPQQDKQTPPNAERQPNVERMPEIPPTTPPGRRRCGSNKSTHLKAFSRFHPTP